MRNLHVGYESSMGNYRTANVVKLLDFASTSDEAKFSRQKWSEAKLLVPYLGYGNRKAASRKSV